MIALRRIAYYKDRAREAPRVMAYRNAADVVEALDDAERERHGQANSWQSLPGIGPKTAKVIDQAWSGRELDALVELRSAAEDFGGGEIRAGLPTFSSSQPPFRPICTRSNAYRATHGISYDVSITFASGEPLLVGVMAELIGDTDHTQQSGIAAPFQKSSGSARKDSALSEQK